MTTTVLLSTCLVLHIIGLTVMAGVTLIDTIIYRQFWKQYNTNQVKAAGTLEAAGKLTVLFGVGFLLLLLSGVGIMLLTKGIFGEQTWFRIKMILVIAVVINGQAFGRRTGIQVQKACAAENSSALSLAGLKRKLSVIHLLQLGLFLAIFILGVFKFN